MKDFWNQRYAADEYAYGSGLYGMEAYTQGDLQTIVSATSSTAVSSALSCVSARCMVLRSDSILLSILSTLTYSSVVPVPWSICALDRYPKIPMLVMNMSTTTAIVR